MGKYCCRCKVEQPLERQKNSYCNPCKQQRRKEARIASREARGLPAWGSLKKICPDCKGEKQDPTQGYCNSCRAVRNKAWALKTGRVQKHNTGRCPCGAERDGGSKYFCKKCKAEDSRKWRELKRPSEEELKKKEEARKERASFKRKVRKFTAELIRRGILVKGNCEVCGTTERVETHHDDYNKPYEVRWLCRKHHLAEHKGKKF